VRLRLISTPRYHHQKDEPKRQKERQKDISISKKKVKRMEMQGIEPWTTPRMNFMLREYYTTKPHPHYLIRRRDYA
jgi:hypothetical protein